MSNSSAFSGKTWLRLLALTGLVLACVAPYEPDIRLSADVLVVEGTLTDQPGGQPIRIGRSRVYNGVSFTAPLKNVRAELVVNGAQVVPLRETPAGDYQPPADFRGQVGSRYQLRFQLPDGPRYESATETMPAVSAITKVYDQFDAQGIVNAEKTRYTPANLIYLDTPDPATERNFYRWEWTLWESQNWCVTCKQGRYYVIDEITRKFIEDCLPDRFLPQENLWDYACRGECWEILRSFDVTLFADQYANGRTIAGKLVAKIPYYQPLPALIEVRQYALTAAAYRYYQLLANQTQNAGSLTDPPPAAIVGNVRNLDDAQENVVGYFTASALSRTRYWLTRQANTGQWVGLFEALNNRKPNLEPFTPFPPRPPQSLCVPGDTRTPVKPEGWPK